MLACEDDEAEGNNIEEILEDDELEKDDELEELLNENLEELLDDKDLNKLFDDEVLE